MGFTDFVSDTGLSSESLRMFPPPLLGHRADHPHQQCSTAGSRRGVTSLGTLTQRYSLRISPPSVLLPPFSTMMRRYWSVLMRRLKTPSKDYNQSHFGAPLTHFHQEPTISQMDIIQLAILFADSVLQIWPLASGCRVLQGHHQLSRYEQIPSRPPLVQTHVDLRARILFPAR